MPSTETRSRLKAFQFIAGKPTDQENAPPPEAASPSNSKTNLQSHEQTQNEVSETHLREVPPPATPATRLPLADLIGNIDENADRSSHPDISPGDQLHWAPQSSFNASRTPVGQSRKRARSSSPASSQNEASAHFLAERRSLEGMKQVLRTPQADPTVDLWSRYDRATYGRDALSGHGHPGLQRLMNDSSPRSPGLPGTGGKSSLRRWASEGNALSNPRAKRRKTTAAAYKDQIEDAFTEKSSRRTAPGQSTLQPSRVEFLVEQMQQTLKKPTLPHNTDEPSSSSPLPEHGACHNEPSQLTSPLQKLAPVEEERNNTAVKGHNSSKSRALQHLNSSQTKQTRREVSSDFGSEDLTSEMVQTMEMTQSASANVVRGAYADMEGPDDAANKDRIVERVTTAAAPNPSNLIDFQGLEDVFDDFEDESMLAADMENVASMYDLGQSLVQDGRTIVGSPMQTTGVNTGANVHGAGSGNSTDPFVVIDDDDDDFGGDEIDDDEFATAEAIATQTQRAGGPNNTSSDTQAGKIQRYFVIDVVEGDYDSGNGFRRPEKILLVQKEHSKINKAVTLRGSWYDTPCTPKSYIHVIGDFTSTGQCTIDDLNNMIILHPDHLVSATVVADSFECMRRAVLQDRVKATSAASEPLIYGTILHELFQEAMTANRWDTGWLYTVTERLVLRHLESIYELNLTVSLAVDALKSKLPELQTWAELFVTKESNPAALVKDRSGREVQMSITKLLDVEEHIWSPKYGLKGNIDATVEIIMHDDGERKRLTVPLEVKTGGDKAGAAHRAQTALYTLLTSDRYDVNVVYGILYYMEKSKTFRIPAIRHELLHMVMQRNRLACYVRDRLELPPMLDNSHKCKSCYAKPSCFVYHKLSEDGHAENSAAKQEFEELVKGLKPVHADFFKKWDRLLTKEESELMRFKRELWTMLSTEREKVGRCFAHIVLEPGSLQQQPDTSKINRFQYTFVKQTPRPGFSFVESQLTVGEPIVISDEKGHFALANGYVTGIGKRRIKVAVDRRLHNARIKEDGFDEDMNQTFTGIMEVGRSEPGLKSQHQAEHGMVYRLDKDEFSNGMATVRNNLIQTMTNEFHARKLRELLVEDIPPRFKPASSAYSLSGPLSQMDLNSDQRSAIEKVMAAEDYALVLGMPGTGKTTTIAHIIRALVAKGKSVLLTSYTHTAVDNILLKIRNDQIDILRLGAITKVHPEIQGFAKLAAQPRNTIEELNEVYMKPQVIATTCLGINHHVFRERIFDYCIVDEASQITLPVCLGPIRMAKTFVLVGDHFQLPPLVQNKEAQEGGLDVSLFKLLSDKHAESVVCLEHQYRMSEDIMLLSNTLIYNGRLKCGTELIARRTLSVPNMDGLWRFHPTQLLPSKPYPACRGAASSSCWISELLTPRRRVAFANTDTLLPASREEANGSRIINMLEANLTSQLIESLLAVGVPAQDIGVITFYRSQLAILKQRFKHRPELEMHTADRFQGRDKEVVVLSCVRSNEASNVGDLLKDWRRVNVALTRARSKLIILGSKQTLCGNELLQKFVGLVEERGWIYDLPKHAEEMHEGLGMNSSLTQLSPTKASPLKGTPVKRSPPKESPTKGSSRKSTPKKAGSQILGESPTVGKAKVPVKKPLGETKANVMKPFKQPSKVGKISKESIVGGRPVLRDIVNDALSQ
ncbi:MAG: Tripartite DNA replication factor [Bogoriella megaspora]|nr:MAG: Tripartite DNA replication factor [Bogoriella megaspora]